MIKAIIFDADGTLYKLNKERAKKELFKFLEEKTKMDANELKEKWKEMKKELLSSSDRFNPEKRRREYLLKKLLEYFNIEQEYIDQLVKEALDLFWFIILTDIEPMPHVVEVVNNLSARFSLIVSSEEFRNILERKLNKIFVNWKDYFKFLITPEDTGTMKPSKKFYEIALNCLNVKPENVLVVGNSWEKDLIPAKELKIKTILIGDLKEGEPDFWIKSLEELKNIIKSFS